MKLKFARFVYKHSTIGIEQGAPWNEYAYASYKNKGGSRTAATSKMEHFVIIGNCWKPLTIIIKSSILDVATVLGPPLRINSQFLVYV